MVERKFGWLPELTSYRVSSLLVAPLDTATETIEGIRSDPRSDGTWLHPPLVEALGSAPSNRPLVPAVAFSVEPTHLISAQVQSASADYLEFQIQVLGFTLGLRLIPDGWSHFYRMPLRPRSLIDFVCGPRDVEALLGCGDAFWWSHPSERLRRLMFGAIHWFLFSKSYVHQFEEFNAQYTVLDTCFRLHCELNGAEHRVNHGERARFLCESYGIPVPSWAEPSRGTQCRLSLLRNELVHEAQYAGAPIGFEHPPDDYPLDTQLSCLNSRLIVALLGLNTSYVRSHVDTRCQHGLGLEGGV